MALAEARGGLWPDGGNIVLEDPHPSAVEWLERAVDDWWCTRRWDLRPDDVSPLRLSHLLWEGVELQKVACVVAGDVRRPVALFQVSGLELDHGVGHLDGMADPEAVDVVRDVFLGVVERVVATFGLRHLYASIPRDRCDLTAWAGAEGPQLELLATMPARLRRAEGVYADQDIYQVCSEGTP